MSEVITEVEAGTGRITLNRPQAINALTLEVLHDLEQTLLDWRADEAVERVVLTGAGERGYCAGADVRQLRELVLRNAAEAFAFLVDEYRLDALIADYPKPFSTEFFGVSMGGGLGLGLHGSRRIGGQQLRLAMPETGIGLWPDVGVNYELARTPGRVGEYLAMTGEAIDGPSAVWAGLLDTAPGGDPADSLLAGRQDWIDECFAAASAEQVLAALAGHHDPEARRTGELIAGRSPLSVCVSLEALRRARLAEDVHQVLDQDLALASHFVVESDFVEGVRAQLIDKDRSPHWAHPSVGAVPADLVASMFVLRQVEGA